MHDGVKAGHGIAARERFERLTEVRHIRGEVRNRTVGRIRFRRWHPIDVHHLVSPLGEVTHDDPAGLATPPCHGDPCHPHSISTSGWALVR